MSGLPGSGRGVVVFKVGFRSSACCNATVERICRRSDEQSDVSKDCHRCTTCKQMCAVTKD